MPSPSQDFSYTRVNMWGLFGSLGAIAYIAISFGFLCVERQFYWHGFKSLKMQEVYEGALAATELYDIGLNIKRSRWEYLKPYEYMYAYFMSGVDCTYESEYKYAWPWNGFVTITAATGCNTTVNASALFDDDSIDGDDLDDSNFFSLHQEVGVVGSTKNFCTLQKIALFTGSKTDENACGVNSYNEQGCYAGFYTPLQSGFSPANFGSQSTDNFGPARPCAPGYFCPSGMNCMIPCLPGTICVLAVHSSSDDDGGGDDAALLAFDDADEDDGDDGSSSSNSSMYGDDAVHDDDYDPSYNPYSSQNCRYPYGLGSADTETIFNKSMASTNGQATEKRRQMCPGAESVDLCPAGYYCKTPLSATKCRKGHFCPKGSYKQHPCLIDVWCDREGLHYPDISTYVLEFIFAGFIFVGIFFIVAAKIKGYFQEQRRHAQVAQLQERIQYRERYYSRGASGMEMTHTHHKGTAAGEARGQPAKGDGGEDAPSPDERLRGWTLAAGAWKLKPRPGIDSDHEETIFGASFSTHAIVVVVTTAGMAFAVYFFTLNGGWFLGLLLTVFCCPCLAISSLGIDIMRRAGMIIIDAPARNSPEITDAAPVLELGSLATKTDTRINIEVRNLGLQLNSNGQAVLKGVNGTLQSGSVTALMGPSGAGKTTFLNTLSGRATYGKVTGEMLINGEERELNSISPLVGFVPQDDVMHRELTVRETLKYYARLRNRKTASHPWGHDQIERRVQDVIEVLGIGHIVDSPIGDEAKRGISGGQRKRVNVGMEMVADPSLLFLDEPTSGLDSTTSYELVTALSNLALKGVNVIAVLHQPSFQLYEQFHNVLLLGAGGRTVYLGPAKGALGYFTGAGFDLPQHMNPADFFMDVIAGKVGRNGLPEFSKDDLFPLWNERRGPIEDGCKHSLVSAAPLKAATIAKNGSALFTSQVFLFAKRAGQQHIRAVDAAIEDVFLLFFIGIFLGYAYDTGEMSDVPNTSLMFSFGLSLGVGLASLRVFGAELLVFWREAAPGAGMGLSRLAYFMGKNIVEIPRIFLLTFVCSTIFYPIAKMMCSYSSFLLRSFFLSWHVAGIAQYLSVALDGKTAQLALVILLLVFLLEAGVQTPFYQMSPVAKGISWLSPSRWFVDGITVANAKEMSVAYRLPPTWYGSSSDSLFALLKKFWMPEALFNPPTIEKYRGLRRMAAMWTERQNLWYEYSDTPLNLTGAITPVSLPFVPINVLMSLYWGIVWRVLAFVALCECNRDKMGKPSFASKIINSASFKCLHSYCRKQSSSGGAASDLNVHMPNPLHDEGATSESGDAGTAAAENRERRTTTVDSGGV